MATTANAAASEVEAFASGLDEFMRALRTARGRFNRAPLQPELSASQFHLLEPLTAADGPLAVCALADAADVAAPTATRMLDGLVKRGLAERVRPEEGDRRREEVFQRLSPSERRAAARLLHSLAAAIDELHP